MWRPPICKRSAIQSKVITVSRRTSQDTTPPSVNCPANLTVEATSAAGVVVTFTATASDAVDGALTPTCSPASGSTFPLGTTTVTCTAIDAANNQGTCTFTVTVLTSQQAAGNLIGQVLALVNAGVLNSGNGNALTSKLNAAIQQMNQGNPNAALNQLRAFINQVNAFVSAGKLTANQAQPLINAANAIIQSLGGP